MKKVIVGMGNISNRFVSSHKDLKRQALFFKEAISSGFTEIDTSDSYYAGYAEKFLAKIIKPYESSIKIDTKTGGVRSSLNLSLANILVHSRALQKKRLIMHQVVSNFDTRIDPSTIENRAQKSLQRLRIEQIETYYLHGLPEPRQYDEFVHNLIEIKKKGITKKVGVSTDVFLPVNFEWCDRIQIPIDLLDSFENFAGEITLNQVFSSKKMNINTKIDRIKNDPRITKVVLGTRKVERLINFEKIING